MLNFFEKSHFTFLRTHFVGDHALHYILQNIPPIDPTYLPICMNNVCSLHDFQQKLMIKESNDARVGENYVCVGFFFASQFLFTETRYVQYKTAVTVRNRIGLRP